MTWTPSRDEVVPVLDALRVALAHQEDDRRGVGRGVVRQLRLPVGRDLAGLRGDRVDVAGERQRHHLRLEAVDHRARLRARAAVRGLDVERRVALGLPVRVERLVELAVELARRVVGDVEQRGRLRLAGRPSARRQRQKRREPDAAQAAGEPPADLAPGGARSRSARRGPRGAPAGAACRTCRSALARAPDARRSPPARRSASSTSGSQDWPWSSVGLPLLRRRPLGRVRSLARAAPVGDFASR